MNRHPHEPKPLRPPMATEILPLLEAEARGRQVANLRQGAEVPVVAKLPQREEGPLPVIASPATAPSPPPSSLPNPSANESRTQAAKQMNVAPRYVSDAKKLKAEERQ